VKLIFKQKDKLGMVVNAYNPSTQEAEAGRRSLRPTWATKGNSISEKKSNNI
jgi:hypothetical protein